MPEEINFLPADEHPKKKKSRNKEEKTVEFSRPAKSEEILRADKVPGKKIKGGFGKLLRFLKEGEDSQTDSAVSLNIKGGPSALSKQREEINKTRLDLLKQIKSKGENSAGAVNDQKREEKKIEKSAEHHKQFSLSGIFSVWRRSRQESKDKRRREKAAILAKKAEDKERRLQEKAKKSVSIERKENKNKSISEKVAAKQSEEKNTSVPLSNGLSSRRMNILGTNLIRGQEFQFFNWPRAIKINIISILAVLLVVGALWGYLIWLVRQSAGISENEKNILTKEEELKDLKREVETFARLRDKAKEVKNLLDSHVYWTNFFSYLEEATLPGVYYEGFSGDLTGEYTLPVIAKDFTTFVAQMRIFQKDGSYILSAGTAEVQIEEDEDRSGNSIGSQAAFDADLKFNKEIFYKE